MKPTTLFPTIAALLITIMLHSQSWVQHSSGSVSGVMRMSFPSNDTGYIINDVNQLRKTVNGDMSWSSVSTPNAPYITDVHFMNGNTGVVSGDTLIFKTTNGGASWTQVFTIHEYGFFGMLSFPDPLHGFISFTNSAMDSLRFYKTVDGGSTWSYVSSVLCYSGVGIYFQDATTGFYVDGEAIAKTIDGGVSWDTVYAGSTGDVLQPITFANADTGYATYQMGNTLRTVDGGMTWTMVGNPGAIVYDLHFFDGMNGVACGGDGFSTGWVMRTNDGGNNWSIDFQNSNTYLCFAFPSDTVGYCGGTGGYVLKYSTVTGIEESNSPFDFSLYPNPSRSSVHLSNLPEKSTVKLFDAEGRMMMSQDQEQSNVVINTSDLVGGVYFIEVSDGKNVTRKKLIIQ